MAVRTPLFTLLLDQDGPLADFDQRYWDYCAEQGFELDIKDLSDTRRHRFMEGNIIDREHRKAARAYIESGTNRWFRDLPVTAGAEEGVDALLSAGVDIWVCTKPLEANENCRDDKGRWIKKHFPMLENKLILAPDKSMVRGDVLLDDAIKIKWIPKATWRAVAFATPFNGNGTEWGHLPHWSWGDPIEKLTGD